MNKKVIGILAHVDAGKTTLSEGMLYTSGSIRRLGRVDNKDAFLDNNELERARGITIFSKQASFAWKNLQVTLLDTPGHVDFSAEMERTLQVLDAAILVISGADGVQGHTRTLWYLLRQYRIPTFVFVNKMDQAGTDREKLMEELKTVLDDGCVDFAGTDHFTAETYEQIAMCGESALEEFLETGEVSLVKMQELIRDRKLFPCFFGSALKMTGVQDFMDGMEILLSETDWPAEFGARVFKISRDNQGNRLTWLKITGGSLKVKTTLTDPENTWEEKINQIRLYSGEKFELANEAPAGTVCAVTGLTQTAPGDGLGRETTPITALLQPVLTYQIQLPPECEVQTFLPRLRQLEEEEPELHIVWNETLQEIHAQVMGEVQIEILKSLIRDRYGVTVEFGTGNIVYKETILTPVEGVGHYEPLRHYAEVHLLLEPGEPGSGLRFASGCSEDDLDRNWQRLILTHLEEKEHVGVLTGSAITDLKITLVAGRAHLKHTEGGDFRQATYRAVRHALMQTDCMLLEPWYEFRLEIPTAMVGRAMTDIEKMHGKFEGPFSEGENSVLTGSAPVACMRDYQREVTSYSRGYGRLFCTLKGYEPCHNTEEVMMQIDYDPLRDLANSPDSVFCAHGAGFVVPWDRVTDYMHLEGIDWKKYGLTPPGADRDKLPRHLWTLDFDWDSYGLEEDEEPNTGAVSRRDHGKKEEMWVGTDEIDAILARTYNANKKAKDAPRKEGWHRRYHKPAEPLYTADGREWSPRRPVGKRDKYLLVDGYNIIFAWEDLKELANVNVDGARGRLQDILCDYQGASGYHVIVVFDAYRVQGHPTEISDYHNIHVVFTKEAETADQYIEKFTHENAQKYDITVATSDGLEQIIIRGAGSRLLSARDLRDEIEASKQRMRSEYLEPPKGARTFLLDNVSEEVREQLRKLEEEE